MLKATGHDAHCKSKHLFVHAPQRTKRAVYSSSDPHVNCIHVQGTACTGIMHEEIAGKMDHVSTLLDAGVCHRWLFTNHNIIQANDQANKRRFSDAFKQTDSQMHLSKQILRCMSYPQSWHALLSCILRNRANPYTTLKEHLFLSN